MTGIPIKKAFGFDNRGHRSRVQQKFLEASDTSYMQDYEFLELILMKAIPRRDVKPIAKALLYHFGTFSRVLHAEPEELYRFTGVKESTATLFKIITEATERLLRQDLIDMPVLDCWQKVVDYCCMCLQDARIEQFLVLYFNAQMQLLRREIPQTGTHDRVYLYPNEVVRTALLLGAKNVVIAHNHPSNHVEPSLSDFKVTGEIYKSLMANDIRLIDHLIVGAGRHTYSFSAHGRLSANPRVSDLNF